MSGPPAAIVFAGLRRLGKALSISPGCRTAARPARSSAGTDTDTLQPTMNKRRRLQTSAARRSRSVICGTSAVSSGNAPYRHSLLMLALDLSGLSHEQRPTGALGSRALSCARARRSRWPAPAAADRAAPRHVEPLPRAAHERPTLWRSFSRMRRSSIAVPFDQAVLGGAARSRQPARSSVDPRTGMTARCQRWI